MKAPNHNMVQSVDLLQSNCISWSPQAKSPAGAVQSAQWRELDSSSSRAPAESPRSCAVPVGSRNFVPRPLAVEPPTGGKNMRAPRPHTPRQVRITCTPANKFAVFIKIVWCRCVASAAVQPRRLVVHSTKSPRRSGPNRSVART